MPGAVAPLCKTPGRAGHQLLQTRRGQRRPPEVNAAFRIGLGADFPFLSDQDRKVVQQLDMTETSKSRGITAIPYTFCLMPDLTVHNLYCGYWYVGRPTLDELRKDLREMMKKVRPDFDPQ